MREEQFRIAWVEPYGFDKVSFAPLPISTLPREPRQQPRYLAVVWEKLTRTLEVMFCRV
jgi:hypothetical protein